MGFCDETELINEYKKAQSREQNKLYKALILEVVGERSLVNSEIIAIIVIDGVLRKCPINKINVKENINRIIGSILVYQIKEGNIIPVYIE